MQNMKRRVLTTVEGSLAIVQIEIFFLDRHVKSIWANI
jgi:hypothetical protein